MVGALVPVVMMRRYTALIGSATFSTVAIEATDYQNAILSAWRGPTSGDFYLHFEESIDQKTWTECDGTESWDPGENTEGQVTAALSKRWFRVTADVTGFDSPRASCWVLGFLERRES